MAGNVRAQDWNALVSALRQAGDKIAQLEGRKQARGAFSEGQHLLIVKVESTATSGGITTYGVRVVYGPTRAESGWAISQVLSADPDATFAIGAYAVLIMNPTAPHYLIAGGGAGEDGEDGGTLNYIWTWTTSGGF